MTEFLIRILAKIGFKQAIQNYVYQHQSKDHRAYMEHAFNDSKGKQYYYFPDLNHAPLALMEKLQELQEQMRAKVPGRDLDAWIAGVEKMLNDEKERNKITKMGHWLESLKEVRAILFNPTILLEIAALLYIREDENPAIYNEALHKAKFDQLWHDSREGAALYDFFQQAGLRAYIPSVGITKENWKQFLEEQTVKTEKFRKLLSQTLTSVSESGALGTLHAKT